MSSIASEKFWVTHAINMKVRHIHLTLAILALASSCYSGVLRRAEVQIVASRDGTALLRIEPGNDTYHETPGNLSAHAIVYQRNEGTGAYDAVSSFALRNPIAPVIALISSGGRFIVTFDDWNEGIGCTPNVVVVYRGTGKVIKAWALEDLFTAKQIKRFPKYINSSNRPWRGPGAAIVELEKRDPVIMIQGNEWHDILSLDLATMRFNVTENHNLTGTDPAASAHAE